jgi:hypothetical protein
MHKSFLILLFVLMTAVGITKAQKPELVPAEKKPKQFLEYYIGNDKFKERNNWVTFGFGPNFYPSINNFVNANMSLDLHYFDKQDRLWNVGYRANTQDYLVFGGATVYLHELKLGRGIYRVEKQYWKYAAFIGPSIGYTNYYPTDTTKSISGKRTIGIGVQAQAEIVFKPVYDFGIALIPFVSFNTTQTVMGITLCVYGSNALVKSKHLE